jgi:hypothetical protein
MHILSPFPVRAFNTELWPLISYTLCIKSNNPFSSTSLDQLAGIQQNFMGTIKTKNRCAYRRFVPFRPSTQGYGPWLVMQNAYRGIIISVLFLYNHWHKFNETVSEPSILRGDAHIVTLFRSDLSTKSYDHWLFMQYAYRAIIPSVLYLSNYLQEFNDILLEPSVLSRDVPIIAFLWSDPSRLISYAVCI